MRTTERESRADLRPQQSERDRQENNGGRRSDSAAGDDGGSDGVGPDVHFGSRAIPDHIHPVLNLSNTLYRIKPRFQAILRPLVDRIAKTGVRPNHLTIAAVGVSITAGLAVGFASATPRLLWFVPVLYLIRMALNAMDGLLARNHNLATRFGGILNELGDVVSDSLAYLPFAILLPDQAMLIISAVAIGLISEVVALAAADTAGRRNDGPLGKSDRAVAFGLVAVLAVVGIEVVLTPVLIGMVLLGLLTIRNRVTHQPEGDQR